MRKKFSLEEIRETLQRAIDEEIAYDINGIIGSIHLTSIYDGFEAKISEGIYIQHYANSRKRENEDLNLFFNNLSRYVFKQDEFLDVPEVNPRMYEEMVKSAYVQTVCSLMKRRLDQINSVGDEDD